MTVLDDLIGGLVAGVKGLRRDVDALQLAEPQSVWRGTKATDFSLADLPNAGDYGYQTTAEEIQINVGGTIRALATTAV